MRAGAQARTIFAGLGATGSLVGAIGTVFALTGGVLAFTGWPDAPSAVSRPALDVPTAFAGGGAAHRAPALQLPAPTRIAAPVRRTSTPPHRGAPGRVLRTNPVTAGTPPQAPVPTPTPPATLPVAPAPPAATAGLGTLAEKTTDATADTVRKTGALVPALAPVTNTVADTVSRAGHLLGPVLQGLSAQR